MVTFSNLWKELKRRLRKKKRWLSLGAVTLVAGAAALGLWLDRADQRSGAHTDTDKGAEIGVMGRTVVQPASNQNDPATIEALNSVRSSSEQRSVFVQKRYVCGEETEKLGPMPSAEIIKKHEEHPEWNVVLDQEGSVFFVEDVEDLAPKCKENGYFGLDKSGNLSLFDGLPEQDHVIRTFFQLNVEHLKSSLPQDAVKQLYSGIRIADLADYNSVLSTFSEYAVEATAPLE